MTNEEIQKTMEFIIKQQESFTENMEQLRESHVKGEARLSRLEGAFVALYNSVSENSKAVKELVEAQKRTDAQLAETDERLNIFINTVEKYLSEGRNGKSQQ
jgi:DNA repair ATPase RecN